MFILAVKENPEEPSAATQRTCRTVHVEEAEFRTELGTLELWMQDLPHHREYTTGYLQIPLLNHSYFNLL